MDNITHVKQGELSHFTIVCISYTCIYKCITRYGVTTNSFPNVASPMFASLFYFKWLYIFVKWGKGERKKIEKWRYHDIHSVGCVKDKIEFWRRQQILSLRYSSLVIFRTKYFLAMRIDIGNFWRKNIFVFKWMHQA